jgi:hypothetical protein
MGTIQSHEGITRIGRSFDYKKFSLSSCKMQLTVMNLFFASVMHVLDRAEKHNVGIPVMK